MTEREQFEAWAHRYDLRPSIVSGRYACERADHMWKAWQARAALAQPVAAEPFAYLVERSAFRVSPHGQDAESNEWIEEAKSDEPGAFPVYRHPPPTPA